MFYVIDMSSFWEVSYDWYDLLLYWKHETMAF